MKSIVTTKALTKHYGSGEGLVRAVDGVNLEIQQGRFTAIIGKSGSGKSTLLHLLGGLDHPTSGAIYVDGEEIGGMSSEELAVYRRRKVGFVFQAYNLIPSLNVWENAVLPLGLDGRKPDEGYLRAVMESLGLGDKANRLPSTLSGGQQQRAAILRALATKPALVLADEPTGNLDAKTGDEVMALLKGTARQFSQTLVVITHDEDIAQTADQVIVLEDGKVVG